MCEDMSFQGQAWCSQQYYNSDHCIAISSIDSPDLMQFWHRKWKRSFQICLVLGWCDFAHSADLHCQVPFCRVELLLPFKFLNVTVCYCSAQRKIEEDTTGNILLLKSRVDTMGWLMADIFRCQPRLVVTPETIFQISGGFRPVLIFFFPGVLLLTHMFGISWNRRKL